MEIAGVSTENCQVCGSKLDYFENGRYVSCYRCGITDFTNISCPNGHYICDTCHGKDVFSTISDYVANTESANPFETSETLMGYSDEVPMLGCENAWIAAGALMSAIKNEGTIPVTNGQIDEVLNRARKQAIGGYCGLTGVCGIAPAIGACFSVILGAACPKDRETAVTMKVVGRIVNAIAGETGPCCCKNFVRTALFEAVGLAKQYLNVNLPLPDDAIVCSHVARHPHGCRMEKCNYYKDHNNGVSKELNNGMANGGEVSMFSEYDRFHSSIYNQEGVLGRKTKHLIALAASLTAGCEP